MTTPTAEELEDRDRAMLQRTAAELTRKYTGKLPADLVERCLNEAYETVASTARIRIYLVATATRLARDKLIALARDKLIALAQATNDLTADETYRRGVLSSASQHLQDQHNNLELQSQAAVPAKAPA